MPPIISPVSLSPVRHNKRFMQPTADISYVRRTLRERGICVLIPTYNNVGTIRRVVEDALLYCADVFVVDDGSDDGTTEELETLETITLISYRRNRGKGYALKTGFRAALKAGFSYAITMDGDGQHFAKDIPAFLRANQDFPGSVIIGSRRLEGKERSGGSKFANQFSNFWFAVQTLHYLPDTQTGYRLYPLKKLYSFGLLTSRYEAELELIVFASWHGVELHSIPVDVYYPPREERVSHFQPGLDFTRISILNGFLCFLSVVYGLPLCLFRKLMTFLRTAWAFLFFVSTITVIFTPLVWLYVHIGKMTEHKRWKIHLLIYHAARFVTIHMGIPGVKFHYQVDPSVDLDKPAVYICNHQSHLDLVYLLSLTPRIIFLTKGWVWHNPLYGFLIHEAEYYPVMDGIGSLLPNFRSLVSRGYSIAIFPEGTRSQTLRVGRFHKGPFYVAEQLGLDIIPVYLYGTGRCLRKKEYHLNRTPVYLEVGKAWTQEELKKLGNVTEQSHFFHHQYIKHIEEINNQMEK